MKTRKHKPQVATMAILGAAFLLTMLASVSAYAFVRTSASVVNDFSVVDCEIEIVEDFRVPDNVGPGSVIVKDVRFENTGRGDCFVRAYVEFDDKLVEQWAHIDYNKVDWKREDDGFWYCKQILSEGQTTPPVCSTVSIDGKVDTSSLKSFDVLALGEAVPAKSPTGDAYPNAECAFQAHGERSAL